MVSFPQRGSCLCGEIGYALASGPLTVYVCHCTDCQRQSGSSFALTMTIRRDSLQIVCGKPSEYSIELADGRVKQARFCSRCSTRLFGPGVVPELAVLEPGTLDDTSWVNPVGHIWVRSKQPWVQLPDDAIVFEKQPDKEAALEMVRAWRKKSRAGASPGRQGH